MLCNGGGFCRFLAKTFNGGGIGPLLFLIELLKIEFYIVLELIFGSPVWISTNSNFFPLLSFNYLTISLSIPNFLK